MPGQDRGSGNGGGGSSPLIRATTLIRTTFDVVGRSIGAACLIVMFAALLANVTLRYAFGTGIDWAYEIHSLLLPWLVAGGIVAAAARGQNIAITLLPDLLTPRLKTVLGIAIHVVIVAISLAVLWSSQPILRASQFQTLSALGVTQIWGYASLVFAFGGMAVISCLNILRSFLGADVMGLDLEDSSFS
ncbi:TRAP transporter small permease [Jannaschia rubra]|uniref:TRAP transporter small permease protein n=1 Tax=Jannaschia rubra TaxID=282197 RepID=A0A0M6XVX1_9RHOB|nr:TRAP transporter small permease subunit [Jannaschia rubra]CTQ34872.1 TRAP-type C4-dicarboxylate transport system, small permease component [Jannaschia rubra]SFG67312.1 TRAP-type C4-dicarboxylate transport system, small permease component [Jannaschia rubra]